MCSLLELLESEDLVLSLIQSSTFMEVCYVFGDTSEYRFGSFSTKPDSKALSYVFSIWEVEGEDTTSNFK